MPHNATPFSNHLAPGVNRTATSGGAEYAAGAPKTPGVPDTAGEKIHHEDGPNLPERRGQ